MQPAILAVTLWEKLTPVDRARVGMALLGLLILLLAILGFVVVAGRMARREVRSPLPPVRDLKDAWARKPLGAGGENMEALEDDDDQDDADEREESS